MLAAQESPAAQVERWAVSAAWVAVEGTAAGRGQTQPGYRTSGWWGRQDRLDTERKHGMSIKRA